jgi:fructan beta-fructosidase
MTRNLLPLLLALLLLPPASPGQTLTREFTITRRYLNFPVSMSQDRQRVHFVVGGDTLTSPVIRIADGKPDYWVFKDLSDLKGKTLTLVCSKAVDGIGKIVQSDTFVGEDSVYIESLRPQFHFSSRRGWNNDPNGLVFHNGVYHMFYQHNPYETQWENMHWGHAVSTDLLHWKELNDALYPDSLGAMFSGSAVSDQSNTSGWGANALVAFYTADGRKETQCVAYSGNNGASFTKYGGNPILRPDRFPTNDSRDPKVFRYEPSHEWVMVLYEEGGISFFTSKNLRSWKFESHLNGFYECPELFPLRVDDDAEQTLWVLTAASGTYMLGDFDGKIFRPRFGKYRTLYGKQYASQTINQTPDGRRIMIGWGLIEHRGMPFNQMMCFPTELTLRKTAEGIRLFSRPVAEIEKLHGKAHDLSGLSAREANEKLSAIKGDLLHVVARFESLNGTRISIEYHGNRIADMDGDEINAVQVPRPDPEALAFDVELLIDRTSVESYFQKGKVTFVSQMDSPKKPLGLEIISGPGAARIHSLKVYELNSIWVTE